VALDIGQGSEAEAVSLMLTRGQQRPALAFQRVAGTNKRHGIASAMELIFYVGNMGSGKWLHDQIMRRRRRRGVASGYFRKSQHWII
jgi:hypothetical protein